MLTKDEAVRIASAAFAQQKGSVADYDVTVEPYHADANQWIVWFERKGPYRVPGGRHAVLVNGITRETVFMPGE